MNEYIKISELGHYDKLTHTGFWREITIRTFTTGEGAVIIQVDPSNTPREKIEEIKKEMKELFQKNEVTESLLWQEWAGVSNFADHSIPIECLSGTLNCHEILNGIKFSVSPNAFFQVNTKGAEVLYGIIRDWADVNDQSIVLDICCGTGSISLFLAKSIKKVIGIEMEASAVEDAIKNRDLNGLLFYDGNLLSSLFFAF